MADQTWDTNLIQEQPITTLIRNTIEKYPLGIGVFQEWLANADDAKASTFKVMIDYNTYPNKTLLSKEMGLLQGPAILIYNNSEFSENDFIGFTKKIGDSNKKKDTDSIGTFGLGALTKYHFTDLISLISGDQVLFLDVHQYFLPKNNKAMKGDFVKMNLRDKYPDQFAPFTAHELFNCNMNERFKGTLFRLPLRTEESSKISKIRKRESISDSRKLIEWVLKSLGPEMLLFLQNIEHIEFWVTEAKSEPRLLISSSIKNMTEELRGKRKFEMKYRHNVSKLLAISYELKIEIKQDKMPILSDWLICCGLGTIKNKDEKEHGRVIAPKGAIAISIIGGQAQRCKGKGFTFLPLISDDFRLPIHVHGTFHLSDNRQNIWIGDNDDKTAWNKGMLEEIIGPLWSYSLEFIAKNYFKNMEKYYEVWPLDKDLKYPWSLVTSSVVKDLYTQNRKVLWCRWNNSHYSIQESYFLSWYPIKPDPVNVLVKMGMPLVNPSKVIDDLLRHALKVKDADPGNVAGFLKASTAHLVKFESLTGPERHQILFHFYEQNKLNLVYGLPIVPLKNGEYGELQEKKSGTKYYFAEQIAMNLLPQFSFFVDYNSLSLKILKECTDTNVRALDECVLANNLPANWEVPIIEKSEMLEIMSENFLENFYICANKFKWDSKPFGKVPLITIKSTKSTLLASPDFFKSQLILATKPGLTTESFLFMQNKLGVYSSTADTEFNNSFLSGSKLVTGFTFVANALKSAAKSTSISTEKLVETFTPENIEAIKEIIEQKNQIGCYMPEEFCKTDIRTVLTKCKVLRTIKGAYVSSDGGCLPPEGWTEQEYALLAPWGDQFICYRDSSIAEKLGTTKIPLSEFVLDFILKQQNPNERTPKFENLMFAVLQKYKIEKHFKMEELKTVLRDIPFIKLPTGEWCKPSEVMDGANHDIVQKLFSNQKLLPSHWEQMKSKLIYLGMKGGIELFKMCAMHISNLKMLASQTDMAIQLVNSFEEFFNAVQIQKEIQNLNEIAFFPAERSLEAPYNVEQFQVVRLYKWTEIYPKDKHVLFWTQAPVLHTKISQSACEAFKFSNKYLNLDTILSNFEHLVTVVQEKWIEGGGMVSDFSSIIDRHLKEINTIYTNRETPRDVIQKILRKLEDLPFIKSKDQVFYRPKRVCFALDEDIEDGIMIKVPTEMKKYEKLLVDLGAEKFQQVTSFNKLPPATTSTIRETIRLSLDTMLDNPDTFPDVTFRVENRDIKAHRFILALNSPKFKAQFGGNFQEGKKSFVIQVDYFSYEAFHLFLKYLYAGVPQLVQSENVLQNAIYLMILAEQHEDKHLLTYCQRWILTRASTLIKVKNVCELFQYAHHHKWNFIESFCLNFISSRKRSIMETGDYKNNLSADLKRMVFQVEDKEVQVPKAHKKEGDGSQNSTQSYKKKPSNFSFNVKGQKVQTYSLNVSQRHYQ